MLQFTIRRTILAVPTLLFISLVIFLLLEFAPGDPMAQVPLTVPPEVKEKMRLALGLGEPVHVGFGNGSCNFSGSNHRFYLTTYSEQHFLKANCV